MVAKRIIPCLDVKDGRVVKGVNFVNLKDAGSAVELSQRYYEEGADELVFLDITATEEKRKTLIGLVRDVAKVLRIPFTVGGGISSLKDIEELLKAGADKVSLNSSIVRNPDLITQAAKQFGSQAVVAAIDVKVVNGIKKVFIKGGKEETQLEGFQWCKRVNELGAGEILLTSMDHDGTRKGYDIEFLKKVVDSVTIPVIASGGAGSKEHFLDAFKIANVDACLAAGLFHYGELRINELKNYLKENNINIRL
ncbi:MAG: imidazole glycerol phosphate synthase subunit HisF [Melioribacter sp.]|uniref:imidazole glycerol phosphate synthase subunit HisF n=1 Tax=Rosettibacter primus TaxID=3111523 RepID=UPI00247D2B31|nr:imidazole glycerol phosphate synthase subunit HisF [Melioribacter sp.]